MPDSYFTVIDTETQQPKKIKLTDNGDGTFSYAGPKSGSQGEKFAKIDAATSGNNTLVAAVASKKIRVLSLFLIAKGDVDVRLESGADGTALTGQMGVTNTSGFVLPYNPAGWFETAVATLLNLELSAAVSVDGALTYIEV